MLEFQGSEVKHIQVGTKYHVLYKREATKGIDGFVVEASDDDYYKAITDAGVLYQMAINKTLEMKPAPEESKK
jgi:hypothetical protein